MRPYPAARLLRALFGILVAVSAGEAAAAKIGEPVIDIRLWGITDAPNGPGLEGPGLHGPLLGFATELDLDAGGGLVRQEALGIDPYRGTTEYVEAGIANGGDRFWAWVDTPVHYSTPNRDYIGGESLVRIYQSYTKDSEDASLTFTYTNARTSVYAHVEFGPQCSQGGDAYCLRAGMVSFVRLVDGAGDILWADAHQQHVWSMGILGLADQWGSSIQDGHTVWPLVIEESGVGGLLEYSLHLSAPATTTIDLSDVAVGEEFTVVYELYAYALDTSADASLVRGANSFSKDPLGGDTGVRFDLVGLTPTNNPSVLPTPVPEPATVWILGAGLLVTLVWLGRARKR
jgi:hypothetical protein